MANTPKNPEPTVSRSSKKPKEPTRKIAVLFTDMKGSTAFYKKHGDLAGRIMIQKLNDMLFPIISKHRGVIVKTIGDSIMAYFRSPAEALWAAVKMQKRLKTHNDENRSEDHLLIRTAINYGHGIVETNDIFGDVVNIAGKLISSCEAKQIIITEYLYAKIKDSENISLSPYQIKESKKELQNLNIYQVEWEKAEAPEDTGKQYLLSLIIEKTSKKEHAPGNIEKILSTIKHDSDRQINIEENEANVIFNSWKACIETAKSSLSKYLEHAPDSGDLSRILRFGLHAVDNDKASPIDNFTEPVNTREKADPYGIVITSAFYNEMSTEFKNACTVHQESPCKLYAFHCENIKKRSYEIPPLIPEEALTAENAPCFYCSSTKHLTSFCPSKFIRKKTGFLDKLGYIPITKLQALFHKSFLSIVQPLESGMDEERFEMLFKENREDLYTTAFFSFYEISEVFQLRSLRQIYMETNLKVKNHKSPKELLLGEDCLRVSKLEKAGGYFHLATKNQPDDFRPCVTLGLLCIETSKPDEAILHFRNALSFSLDENIKNYLHLLITRIYETSGALGSALKEIKKIGRPFSEKNDMIYYYAVLLAKAGETDSAIGMFKSLMQFSSRYYLMVSLNPELSIIQQEITGLLTTEFTSTRDSGNESINRIKRIIDEYRHLIDEENEDYKKALELYRKALHLSREESISGLIDIQSFETSITSLTTGAINRAFSVLKKKISKFRQILNDNAEVLAQFPYKSALSKKDFKRQDNFKALINEAGQTTDTKSFKNLKKARELIEQLTKASSEIAFNQKRLEIIEKAIFVVEFSSKSVFVFISSGALLTFLFTSILVIYKMYENSMSSLSSLEFISILKFGICAGVIFATFLTGLWIKKKYS